MKQKGILVLALVLAVAAVVLLNIYVKQLQDQAHGRMEEVHVVKAARDIPAGTKLDVSMIKTGSIPKKFFLDHMVSRQDMDLIMGQTTKHALKKEQAILWLNIVTTGTSGFGFTDTIEKGHRAFSISVDEISGVAGHIRPDDQVDLLGTFSTPREMKLGLENIKDDPAAMALSVLGKKGALEVEMTTITLLQNVKILDTGNIFGRTAAYSPGMNPMGSDASNAASMRRNAMSTGIAGAGYSSVTLLLTPIECEMVMFAQENGKLSLALRNKEDMEQISEELLPVITFTDIIKPKIREQIREFRIQQSRPAPSGPEVLTGRDRSKRPGRPR